MAMDPIVTSSLIGVGATGANIIGNLFAQGKDQQLTRESRRWQERMVNQANIYNSPRNQIQRLLDAGLNPDLMYESGDALQTSASAPSATQPTARNFMEGSPDIAANYLSAENIKAQNRLINAQAESQEKDNEHADENWSLGLAKTREELRTISQINDQNQFATDLANKLRENSDYEQLLTELADNEFYISQLDSGTRLALIRSKHAYENFVAAFDEMFYGGSHTGNSDVYMNGLNILGYTEEDVQSIRDMVQENYKEATLREIFYLPQMLTDEYTISQNEATQSSINTGLMRLAYDMNNIDAKIKKDLFKFMEEHPNFKKFYYLSGNVISSANGIVDMSSKVKGLVGRNKSKGRKK